MRPVSWNSKHHNCGFLPSPIPQVHVGGSSGHSSRKDSLEGFLLEPSCREIPAVENVAASARGLSLGSGPRHTGKARVHDLDKPTQQTACGRVLFYRGFAQEAAASALEGNMGMCT